MYKNQNKIPLQPVQGSKMLVFRFALSIAKFIVIANLIAVG